MNTFTLKLSDGRQSDIEIDALNQNEAINTAFNALHEFACRNFPPPDVISIVISDEKHERIAILQLTFAIEFGPAHHVI